MTSLYREELIQSAKWCERRAATMRKIGLMIEIAEAYENKAARLRNEAEKAPPAPQQIDFGFDPYRRARRR